MKRGCRRRGSSRRRERCRRKGGAGERVRSRRRRSCRRMSSGESVQRYRGWGETGQYYYPQHKEALHQGQYTGRSINGPVLLVLL